MKNILRHPLKILQCIIVMNMKSICIKYSARNKLLKGFVFIGLKKIYGSGAITLLLFTISLFFCLSCTDNENVTITTSAPITTATITTSATTTTTATTTTDPNSTTPNEQVNDSDILTLVNYEQYLTEADIETAYKRVFIEKGEDITNCLIAFPETTENGAIVAYGVTFINGIVYQFVGLAGNEESVSSVHGKAQEWLTKVSVMSTETTNKPDGTINHPEPIGMCDGYYFNYPYGGI